MKTAEEYDALAKKAAYQIVQAIRLFDGEPASIREQAQRIIMSHVQQMLYGEKVGIEGDGLVREVVEAGPEDPINTPD